MDVHDSTKERVVLFFNFYIFACVDVPKKIMSCMKEISQEWCSTLRLTLSGVFMK